MKKFVVILVLSLVCVFCTIGFAACESGGNTADTRDAQILSVYNTYVAYAEENGKTPLSYEEWLNSIKGKDGKDGANGIDGINGKDGVSIVKIEKTSTDNLTDTYTITYSDGNTTTFTITNGEKGEKGDMGAKGDTGAQGEKGDKGDTGAQGEKGEKGDTGAQGEKGDKGDTGAQGEKGDKGDTGAQGEKGEKGDTGAQGEKGDKGDTGAQGEKGDKGDTGAQGDKGDTGLSAYEIFLKYYPYYTGTEEQWINGLVNGDLKIYTITFKSEVADDIVKYVFKGYDLTDIPEVPEKEGQTSAVWDITDFSNITEDITVNAVYDMRKYITFHNEYTDDEDIIKVVNYGYELTEIPEITEKTGNTAKWSITDFSKISEDLFVQAIYETQGLQYVAINQQKEYRVSKGEISTDTKELFIPAEYNGKPITVIDEHGFDGCYIRNIYLTENIIEIRDYAFFGCRALRQLTIPSSVVNIGYRVFECCAALENVIILAELSAISSRMFAYCTSLKNLTVPSSVTIIGDTAFLGCDSLTSFIISDGVSNINIMAFSDCINLVYIIIPNSVQRIESRVLNGCQKLETIYYQGNASDFEKIIVADDNSIFKDAMVYYYSETEPTESGDFWHYDIDGETPIIWDK